MVSPFSLTSDALISFFPNYLIKIYRCQGKTNQIEIRYISVHAFKREGYLAQWD